MTTFVLVVVVALAVVGLAMGGRHLYLRLDRPRGFECSLRILHGEVQGLSPKFRAGYAGPEMRQLFWRRIARPGVGVRFPVEAIRVDQARRPRAGERLAVPATFSIMPVELDPETTLELAMSSRRLPRLVGMLGGPGPSSSHR